MRLEKNMCIRRFQSSGIWYRMLHCMVH